MGTEVSQRRGERAGEFVGGKYLLEACLGVGGMGEVYRATNVSLGRKVAIKVLGRDMVDNEDDVLRFLREARAAAAVRHPNVVDVLDVARDDDGTPFIVQELLAGEDLEHHVRARGGRLLVDEALEILIPVAEAVAEAHARDVVHRDLKPANIFLAREGTRIVPKVLDFGACLFPTMGGVDAKELRMLIGTPHYMAPEQVTDRAGVDARADVWAIGVILWELLVGEAPFQGATAMDVLRQVKAKEVPPLRDHLPDAPAELAALVAACTKRDKSARISDAGSLAARMREVRDQLRPSRRNAIETLPEIAPAPAPRPPPAPTAEVRPKLASEDDGIPSGLDLAVESKPAARANANPSLPPVLDVRNAAGGAARPARAPEPPPSSTRPLPRSTPAEAFQPAPSLPAEASSVSAVTFTAPRTPSAGIKLRPPKVLTRQELARLAGGVVGPALVLHVLFRFVPLTRQLGHALRGDSVVGSGVAAVVVLVTAAVLAARSLSPERKRSTAVAAVAALVLGIVMIIMTFSASEAAALGVPPAASELVPFVAPVLPGALAYAAFQRVRDVWVDAAERRSAIRLAVLAASLVLLALEAGPTGAVRTAAAFVARTGS